MFASTFAYVSFCGLCTGAIGVAMECIFCMGTCMQTRRNDFVFQSSRHSNHKCLPRLVFKTYVVVCVLQPFFSWLFSGFAAAMPPKKQRRKEKATAVLEENTEKQEEDSLPDALVKHLKNMT